MRTLQQTYLTKKNDNQYNQYNNCNTPRLRLLSVSVPTYIPVTLHVELANVLPERQFEMRKYQEDIWQSLNYSEIRTSWKYSKFSFYQ